MPRSVKRGSSKLKSPKRKSPKGKTPKRKSPKRKSPKRKSPKRKSSKRKTRKSPKRKSTRRSYRMNTGLVPPSLSLPVSLSSPADEIVMKCPEFNPVHCPSNTRWGDSKTPCVEKEDFCDLPLDEVRRRTQRPYVSRCSSNGGGDTCVNQADTSEDQDIEEEELRPYDNMMHDRFTDVDFKNGGGVKIEMMTLRPNIDLKGLLDDQNDYFIWAIPESSPTTVLFQTRYHQDLDILQPRNQLSWSNALRGDRAESSRYDDEKEDGFKAELLRRVPIAKAPRPFKEMLNHDNLVKGKNILCGGELLVNRDGSITINNKSGHYRPSYECLYYAKRLFERNGYKTHVSLFRGE